MKQKSHKWKKELRDIAIFAGIFGFLYIMGWHVEVIGRLQQAVLWTGLMNPSYQTLESPQSVPQNWQLTDENNQVIPFSGFLGKTVLINFWASWCPPCVAEMPSLMKLYQKIDTNIVIVAVNLDDDLQKANEFVKKKGLDLPVYRPYGRIPGIFDVSTIPSTYIISPSGKMVFKRKGAMKFHDSDFIEFLQNIHHQDSSEEAARTLSSSSKFIK
ncbi:MAG: hypothetical protein Kow00108_20770 [Calditrichia bacterium]